MEQVKGAINIDNLVASIGLPALRELNDLAGGGQEVGNLGIGLGLGSSGGEGTDLGSVDRGDRSTGDRATALVVVLSHQQHTTNELGGRDILSTLALSVKTIVE